jgi:hypothetical protein
VSENDERIRLQRRLVFNDTILGDADAIKPSAERAQSANYDSAFQRANDPGDQRTRYY